MKKKTKISAIDPFDQMPSVSEGVKKKLKEVFGHSKIDYTAPPIRIKDDVDDKYVLQLEKLDDWCEKWLENNKKAKIIKGGCYPYRDYSMIDSVIRKHGKKLIEEILKVCPIKGRDVKHEIYDSLAFCIFRKRIDPKSLIIIPSYGSFWDKISDHGHA